MSVERYQQMTAILRSNLGRDATDTELADILSTSIKTIRRESGSGTFRCESEYINTNGDINQAIINCRQHEICASIKR